MDNIPVEYDLDSYDFDLPRESIAQSPCAVRGSSRLMLLDRSTGRMAEHLFSDLPGLLPEGALLVANNSRVVPARLFGRKPSGGRVECLLLTPLPIIMESAEVTAGSWTSECECLLRASKAPKPGDIVAFDAGLTLEVLARQEFGRSLVRLAWTGDLPALVETQGHLPLPPYIERPDCDADRERYQTVYADPAKTGSVAAPTAGLHFTPEIGRALADRGLSWAEVTLYVGYGTFSPIRVRDIRQHVMHREYIELSAATAEAVNRAKAEGRPVVAVGTTSVRTLESVARLTGPGPLVPFKGWTDLFITPGYKFGVVDHVVTNFHLPGSSLIIMVAALAGRERILSAYRRAVESGFRFFSYGDAMLIL